jgi:hypothetical protein
MWEVRAAEGRLADLIAYLLTTVPAGTQVYQSADERVVVIGETVPGPPADLVARAPHVWDFERVV